MIEINAAFRHHFLQITQAQIVSQIHRTHRRMTDLSKWRPLNIKNTQLIKSRYSVSPSIYEKFATKPFITGAFFAGQTV